jgi:hypothetical protein
MANREQQLFPTFSEEKAQTKAPRDHESQKGLESAKIFLKK